MNSGLDGERNFCDCFSLVTNGNFQNRGIVLLKADANRNQWPMAKVVDINSDAEGFVRSVKLLIGKTQNDGE